MSVDDLSSSWDGFDQDANPDLASRYGDWGWPATIIFDPDGKEIVKLQGFQLSLRRKEAETVLVAGGIQKALR